MLTRARIDTYSAPVAAILRTVRARNRAGLATHEGDQASLDRVVQLHRDGRIDADEVEAAAYEIAAGWEPIVAERFVKDVLQQLPMEFAVEAQKLISISLEGSVG